MATAQAGLWASDPQAYREKMFKLLGDRNPLEVLAQNGVQIGRHCAQAFGDGAAHPAV